MANFISEKEIEAAKALKKHEKRQAREVVLTQAKHDHERRKKTKERRERTDKDKWMAPGVANRFSGSHKHKKQKSKDKKKRSKRSKHTNPSESTSSGSEIESEQWVEKEKVEKSDEESKEKNSESALQRQSWMTAPMAPSQQSLLAIEDRKKSSAKLEKDKAEEVRLSFDTPGQHPRELNPFWKDGGTGLPNGKQSSSKRTGDGGHSWMLRAYKRALEQAESEGKELEEIAIARWGSLDKLYSLLQAAGIDPRNPDKTVNAQKREYLYAEPPKARKTGLPKGITVDYSNNSSETSSYSKQLTGFLMPNEDQPKSNSGKVKTVQSMGPSKSTNWQKHAQNLHMEKKEIESAPAEASQPENLSHDDHMEDPRDHEPEVSDAQLNALSARVMKAEMLGDSTKTETLRKKLEKLRELKKYQESQKNQVKGQESTPQEKAIPLVSSDRFGRVRPLAEPKGGHAPPSKKSKRKKYTNDGESYSIQEMMEEERNMSARDTQIAIAGMASKFVSSSSKDDTIDEKYASKVAISFDPRQNEGKEFVRAMAESKKLAETMENCRLCFGNDNFSKNLLIAVGMNVYLAAPATQSLTDGHCLLIPMEHHTSMIQLDENVWDEIKVFQKGLTRMFHEQGCDVVFTESYMSANKRSHAYLECIPLPKEEGELAPMYFKKAIMESDEEWSVNRKLIDTKAKGVRSSLPVGLPYFFIEFGLDGGFAHIIEDSTRFPSYFAKEIIGGMLDLEPQLWLKPRGDSFETQKQKVLLISEWWKPYDWTQTLKQS